MDAHNRGWASWATARCRRTGRLTSRPCWTRERVDVVLVTSVDVTHDEYIVAALRRRLGGRHRETDDSGRGRCRRILDTVTETGGRVTVTFNYRYNPLHETGSPAARRGRGRRDRLGALRVAARRPPRRRLLPPLAPRQGHLRRADGAQGQPPLRPGQLVAGRHARPGVRAGRLFFYGEDGRRHGYARDYDRAHGSPPPPTTRSRCGWTPPPAARAVPRRRGRGRLPARPQRLRARGEHRGRHGGAGPLLHRRHHDLPPHRVRALGGLPGDGQRQPGPAGAGRGRDDFVARGTAGALKGAALHGAEAPAEGGGAR